MPVSGTVTSSGDMRTGNLGGFSGWGVFTAGAVAADNTYAYALYTNVTNANIGGGLLDCHLVRIPWATWTVAATVILQSFARVTGVAGADNGLGLRQSDGLLAARLHGSDLFTFDPAASYAANRLAGDGSVPSSQILSVAFDPNDPSIIWQCGYNIGLKRWKIGTGDLGAPVWAAPTYTANLSPTGQMVGCATWDASNSPKGVVVWDPATGLAKCPIGLRWLSADRSGAGNGNQTEGNLANRAAISNCRDAVMDKDGVIYALSTVSAALGIRRLTADWLTADAISTAVVAAPAATSHIAVSPDATKLVVSTSEFLMRVT